MPQAVLTWNANTELDLAGYKVYRAVGSNPETLFATLGKVTTYTDATLPTVDGNVSYSLTAYDTNGNESQHSVTVTKVLNTNPPAPPTGLVVVIS